MSSPYATNSDLFKDQEIEDLNQRINRKFIRNVVKPMQYINRHEAPNQPYQIPSASQLLPPHKPHVVQPLNPNMYYQTPPFPQRVANQTSLSQDKLSNEEPLKTNIEQNRIQVQEHYDTPSPTRPTCVDIHGHISSCPVCSQLYRPYTGMFITIIIILVICILFLLKRLFEF